MPDDLIAAANKVRAMAYAPYSGFQVGAAIRSTSGAVHVGCNVENVAYPEGTCAEAGAIAAMIAAGDTADRRGRRHCRRNRPGAALRRLPSETGGVRGQMCSRHHGDVDGKTLHTTVGDLLPGRFGADHMDRARRGEP
jgi:cytidine deaminase